MLLFETITESLRQLTCQKADFVWNGKQERDFIEIKTFISKAPVLSYFHQAFETKIVAGASKQGLGSVKATQRRSLSAAETKYFQSEREALAVVFS